MVGPGETRGAQAPLGAYRGWIEAGKTDDWIADELGTSASSVQAFRSRNGILRSLRRHGGRRGPESIFGGVLDQIVVSFD